MGLSSRNNRDTSLMEVYAIIKLAMENGKVGIKRGDEVLGKLMVEKENW